MALFVALALPARLAAQEQNQQPPRYTVTDLGTLGGTFGAANAVNNRGSVVGFANLPGDTEGHAFLWSKGIKRSLGTLGGPNSSAAFLNERGEVTGFSETSTTPDPLGEDFCLFGTHLICLPFLWQNGEMAPLPTLGGNNGQAFGVNNRGQVVGLAENTTPDPTCPFPPAPPFFSVLESKPVVWEKGKVQELPTIPGDPDGSVSAINDNGQAVGQTGNCTGPLHGVLWHNGTASDLGTLGGLVLSPFDINNRGQVVGSAVSPDGTIFLAFLWQNGVATSLGTLPPDVFSLALGINDRGQIVGDSCDMSFSCRAFLWQNGTMTELNSLVHDPNAPFLETGNGINSRGQIAGKTTVQGTGIADAYLANPCHAEKESCEQQDQGKSAERGEKGEKVKATPRENVRKLLQQRLGSRYHIPGLGAPKD